MRAACNEHARRRPIDPELWSAFARNIFYQQGEYDDPASFLALKQRLDDIERTLGLHGNRVFYLATPPSSFASVIRSLGEAELAPKPPPLGAPQPPGAPPPFARVIIEKPFGTDLETARALNRDIHETLDERPDLPDRSLPRQRDRPEPAGVPLRERHLRAALEQPLRRPRADHRRREHRRRGRAAATSSRPASCATWCRTTCSRCCACSRWSRPSRFDADAVRDEKLKVLKALRYDPCKRLRRSTSCAASTPPAPSAARRCAAIARRPDVSPTSATETFVALKLFIDNWRWAGVPFYLRSGKRLPKRVTEIAVHFKEAPHLPVRAARREHPPNVLAIRIQPDEGISLNFGSKVPGPTMEIAPVSMEFRYGSSFGVEPPEAYERLLLDCLLGDSTLFTRADEVEASWAWVSRIHRRWAEETASGAGALPTYPAGSWGPPAADRLMTADGRAWRLP